ncbi:uncharacterized protein LOC123528463, partial [Mercenaria mercenaria]|uniref:uncharacterized protein LOC123528463 n=1 Tax=Mercenaria mercenaria TaxID=6596 RepID=UPI00234EE1D7
LMAYCVDGEADTDNSNHCTQQIESFAEPVTSFMKILIEANRAANQPFTIPVGDSKSLLRNLQESSCLREWEFESLNTEHNVTCYKQKVLDSMKVVWTPTKELLLLSIAEGSNADTKYAIERIINACNYQVTQKPCKTTTASTTCSCNTRCSTLPTTGTETRNIHTTTDRSTSTKTTGLTTSTETGLPQSQNSEDICAKSSDIVIASICSFVGGVVCSVALLLLVFRRHVCKGTETRKAKDEVIILDDDAVKAEAFVSKGSKIDSDKKTYETLTSMERTKTDEEHSYHVYLGLDTRLRENTLLTNSNEKSKQSQVKEQSEAAKKDHVYNELKSEEITNVYEDTRASDLHDHTYIGLNNRETNDRNEEQGSSKGPEYNDRTSECHDYLVLADDAKGPLANVTDKANEIQGCELHPTELTAVDPSSSDHAYFTLHNIEQSDSSTPDVEQNDEESGSENDTDGHAYHTLERV